MAIQKSIAQKLVDFCVREYIKTYTAYGHSQNFNRFVSNMEAYGLGQGFEAKWSMGGTSCGWSGDTYTVEPEIEPELPGLDEFLIEYYPTMGFLQYKMLLKEVERNTYDESDYYGGSTTHGKKFLSYDKLAHALVQYKVEPASDEMVDLLEYFREHYNQEWFNATFPLKEKKAGKKKQ